MDSKQRVLPTTQINLTVQSPLKGAGPRDEGLSGNHKFVRVSTASRCCSSYRTLSITPISHTPEVITPETPSNLSPLVSPLPPKSPSDGSNLTLALDLDETLVHSDVFSTEGADFSFPVDFCGAPVTVSSSTTCYYASYSNDAGI